MKSEKGHSMKIFICMIFLVTIFIVGKTDAQYEKRVIIVSGQEAPGTNGAVFSSSPAGRRSGMPMPLAISNEGRVVFWARLELDVGDATWGNLYGLWAEENGDVTFIVREQGVVPGLPDQIFSKLPKVYMDLAGQIGLDQKSCGFVFCLVF